MPIRTPSPPRSGSPPPRHAVALVLPAVAAAALGLTLLSAQAHDPPSPQPPASTAAPVAVPRPLPGAAYTPVVDERGRTQFLLERGLHANAQAVVIFSHGMGGNPERYEALFDALQRQRIAVIAPLHSDSSEHPDRARVSLQETFSERLADWRVASLSAARQRPSLPVIAVGHSYGALIAAAAGGALTNRGAQRDPSVRGVVAFSSPGIIPGLVDPSSAYQTLRVPMLTVTGDADVVPGFVTQWQDHLLAFRSAPESQQYAFVVAGGSHALVLENSDLALQARALAVAFVQHAAGDSGVWERLSVLHRERGQLRTR